MINTYGIDELITTYSLAAHMAIFDSPSSTERVIKLAEVSETELILCPTIHISLPFPLSVQTPSLPYPMAQKNSSTHLWS